MSQDEQEADYTEIRVTQGRASKQLQNALLSALSAKAMDSEGLTVPNRVKEAVARVEVAAAHVKEERTRRVQEHHSQGRPALPTHSPRIDKLARDITPVLGTTSRSERDRSDLGRFDRLIGSMQRDITHNPLWLAADHVEGNITVLKLDKLVREAPELQEVQRVYASAEKRFVEAKAQVESFEKQPAWRRWVDTTLRDQDLKLRGAFDHAAEHLLLAKQQVENTERDLRATLQETVAEHNGAELNKQREARERRESIERPLREALIERHIAEGITLRGETTLARLQDAPPGTTLRFDETVNIGGFEVVKLKGPAGQTYLGDSIALNMPAAARQQGKPFDVRKDNDGTPTLQATIEVERTLDRGPLEGKIVDLQYEQGRLTRLTLEQADNKLVSLVPKRDNLLSEVRAPGVLAELKQGDRVHLDGGKVRLIAPAPTKAIALGR